MGRVREITERLRRGVSSVSRGGRLRSDLNRIAVDGASKASYFRKTVEQDFSNELNFLRGLICRHPFTVMLTMLFLGLFIGGVMSATISQYLVVALVGGFPLSILYGNGIGVTVEYSIILVIFLDLFVIYVGIWLIRHFGQDMRLMHYREAVKKRYRSTAESYLVLLDRIPGIFVIAILCFLVGPWVALAVAYMLSLQFREIMIGLAVGLSGSGTVYFAMYRGLLQTVPDPLIVTVVTLVVMTIFGFVLNRILKNRP
jgi:hypothetical protein